MSQAASILGAPAMAGLMGESARIDSGLTLSTCKPSAGNTPLADQRFRRLWAHFKERRHRRACSSRHQSSLGRRVSMRCVLIFDIAHANLFKVDGARDCVVVPYAPGEMRGWFWMRMGQHLVVRW